MRFTICFIGLLLWAPGYGQKDTLRKQLLFDLHVEVLGHQHLYPVYTSKVSQPDIIKRNRQNNTVLPIGFDSVTDNPFRHGAMFAALKSVTNFKNKISLVADLYAEYRGFSYGSFNTRNNLVLFPVIALHARDTLDIGNNKLIVDGKLGQFLNEQLAEGLTVYNLDLQGSQVRFRYKNSRVAFTIYGDLYNAIGLRIDDLKELSFEQLSNNDSSRYGISWTMAAPPYTPVKYHSFFNLYGSVYTKNKTRLYAQIGFMPVLNDFFGILRGLNRQVSMVAGFEKAISRKRFLLKTKTEARYYGHAFNITHSEPGLRYRDSARDELSMYANTVGAFLYPLRKFDAPFSQWAVFTEYTGFNLFALSITGQCNYRLNNKLGIGLDYDLHAIKAVLDKGFDRNPGEERTSFFIYPFFKSSVSYIPLKECRVSFFLTNKSMNLDISYPTHYLHKKPFFGFELSCKI